MLRTGWTALLIALIALPATAQNVSKSGTTAGEFLQIGVGPRASALGGAFVAAVDDASALYWNPAGLSHQQKGEVFAAHSEWLADVDFDFLGVSLPVPRVGTVGVSVTMLKVPEMLVRTEDRQEGTGETFDAADMAVGLSLGRSVTDRFSVGLTAKYIQQRIWHSRATGFAFDLGTQFRTDFFGGLTIGATLFNFGGDMRLNGRDLRTFVDPDPTQQGNNDRVPVNYELDGWSLPLNFQIGLTARPIDTRMHRVTVAADALHPSSNYESLNVGVEYGFQQRFFLRGGFQSLFLEDAEGGLAGGIGVRQPLFYGGDVKLDYAYRSFGRLEGIHVIGLSVTF
ncbi:MAG: PorV/PorQ family protein [Rhodothermales bacterium]